MDGCEQKVRVMAISSNDYEQGWTRVDHRLAEGAGVEPARPEGLAALAVRCLAARPTLHQG
jgi:hypothetical protein